MAYGFAKQKRKKPDPRTAAQEPDRAEPDIEDRSEELKDRPELRDALVELYTEVEKGFEAQEGRANESMDYWDIYNCKLGPKQYYSGNSKIFLPIVHDAVNARRTRFTNQIFPQAGRYIEVVSADGTLPHAEMSLAEHYIRKCKLRTRVVPALCVNGDVEGQYNVYVSWQKVKRHVTYRVKKKLTADSDEQTDDIVQETIETGRPHVEVLADTDVLLLPQTADTVDEALAMGGSATIIRRWSKARIKAMIATGEIDKDAGDQLVEEMKSRDSVTINKASKMVDAAGIRTAGNGVKFAQVYETFTELLIKSNEKPDGERCKCRIFFGSEKLVLACRRNPNWSDKVNLISVPVDKIQGSFKGKSKLYPTEQTQYYANDTINQAADSSTFSMCPIVLTDPEKNPRIGSMVLSLAAVWEADPNSTKFVQFPELWKSGFEIVGACKAQIFQTLSVSPAAITQQTTPKARPSQADIAREQQVDILTTADAVINLEEGILTPIVQHMLELDHQFRNDKLMIRLFGEIGIKAHMEEVDPVRMDKVHSYRWFGVEQARNQMQMQQQVAALGVVMKIPPQMYPGHKLNLVPVITNMIENIFGPRLAPLIFIDEAKQVTLEASLENQFLAAGVDLSIHPMDQDPEHIQEHLKLLQETGDPQGNIEQHIRKHQLQMQLKNQAAMMQRVQQMMGTQPGGPQAGGSSAARAGAQPRGERGNGQRPPGMVPRDQIGPSSGQPPALRQRGQ